MVLKGVYLIIGSVMLLIALASLIYLRSAQTFPLRGELLGEQGDDAHTLKPVQGAKVCVYQSRFKDNRAFREQLQRMKQKAGLAVEFKECVALRSDLARYFAGDVQRPNVEGMTVEQQNERLVSYEGEISPFLQTATGIDGRFTVRLARGSYVLLISDVKTQTISDKYETPTGSITELQVWTSFVEATGETTTILADSDEVCSGVESRDFRQIKQR